MAKKTAHAITGYHLSTFSVFLLLAALLLCVVPVYAQEDTDLLDEQTDGLAALLDEQSSELNNADPIPLSEDDIEDDVDGDSAQLQAESLDDAGNAIDLPEGYWQIGTTLNANKGMVFRITVEQDCFAVFRADVSPYGQQASITLYKDGSWAESWKPNHTYAVGPICLHKGEYDVAVLSGADGTCLNAIGYKTAPIADTTDELEWEPNNIGNETPLSMGTVIQGTFFNGGIGALVSGVIHDVDMYSFAVQKRSRMVLVLKVPCMTNRFVVSLLDSNHNKLPTSDGKSTRSWGGAQAADNVVDFQNGKIVDCGILEPGTYYLHLMHTIQASPGDDLSNNLYTFTAYLDEISWDRYAGDTALDTGKAVVEADGGTTFSAGRGGTVIVATNDGYWDALAAAGLAGTLDSPVLITNKKSLSSQTKAEIQRLRPQRALIMGGTAAVSDAVMSEIAAMGIQTTRFAGDNAVATAVEIYKAGSGWSKTAVVATSSGYWDALSIAPYAWWNRSPIFLTDAKGNIGDAALNAINSGGFNRVVVVGGTAAVSSTAEGKLRNAGLTVVRLAGDTALDTSGAIAEWEVGEGMGVSHLSVATSDGYWDALTGAAICGKNASVLVLVGKDKQKDPWRAYDSAAQLGKIEHGHVLGGTAAVSSAAWKHFTGTDER